MQIESLQVENYKGFADSGLVMFGPGFNVLVGQNNSGKSALLEALRLGATPSVPHSSILYERGATLPPRSVFSVSYAITGHELQRSMMEVSGTFVPVPSNSIPDAESFIENLFSRDRVSVSFRAFGGGGGAEPLSYPSYDGFVPDHGAIKFSVPLNVRADLQAFSDINVYQNDADSVFSTFENYARKNTYVFSAERLNIGRFNAIEQNILDNNAANLPAVLQQLQSNSARFSRYCAHVSEIFPNIPWISVVTVGNFFEIRLWPVNKSTERDDLAFSIMQGGTGVGQVLAILYIAMTMQNSIIAIDEPNNFLHPGAVKKLIEILNGYSSNQYIIATHSTDAILAADPSTIHVVRWENGESRVDRVSISDAAQLKNTLAEVGASLSDVFGPDAIIWVEGETEQYCFPEICRAKLGGVPRGLSFLALRSTSDVESGNRNADKALALYEKISSMGSIIPPVLAFSFDRELRSQKDVADLTRRSQRTVVLPRRTLENYLLSSVGIADVLFEELGTRLETEEVDAWMLANRSQFFAPSAHQWPSDDWIDYVDAPKLLAATFSHFSNDTLEYRKTRHSLMLLKWRLKNEPAEVDGLVEHVRRLIAPPS
jgi:energy-coupling factor transporter ATP-binding protein EcfA2